MLRSWTKRTTIAFLSLFLMALQMSDARSYAAGHVIDDGGGGGGDGGDGGGDGSFGDGDGDGDSSGVTCNTLISEMCSQNVCGPTPCESTYLCSDGSTITVDH